MGDDQDGARIIAQVAFEPQHRLGVEVVGRLIEQEQFRLFEEKPAQCHAPPLAAGQFCHLGVVCRAA